MFKRIFWFSAGAAAGIVGVRRVEREIAERRAKLEPESLASSAADVAGRGAERVRSALEDGRREMKRVTRELEASHDPARRRPRSDRMRRASDEIIATGVDSVGSRDAMNDVTP